MHREHHARVLIGTYSACFNTIPEEERMGPDTDVYVAEQFTIDDARRLKLQATSRPVTAAHRTFIISCAQFTHEAQNALLKLFEDPPATAQFFLIIPRLSLLIPTLRSRVQVISSDFDDATAVSEQVLAFLASGYAARIAQISALQKKKETALMRALIEGIEQAVAGAHKKHAAHMRAVATASLYRDIRGASHKMLLEHIALTLPSPYQSKA